MLVATPLRLLTLLRANCVDLKMVKVVVLDEADKLFEFNSRRSTDASPVDEEEEGEGDEERDGDDEGDDERDDESPEVDSRSSFLNQVDEILNSCPEGEALQRGLFSATIGPFVQQLANSFLRKPVTVIVGVENAGGSNIDQKLVFVGREDGKLLAIRQLIQKGIRPPVLIFMQSKDRAKELYKELVYDGINVDVMHAERSAQQREEVIRRFRVGEVWVLICTDLMARGIDFKGVQMVINYDLPQSPVAYIHRIGRTGRAGLMGTAVTFFTEADMPKLRSIANVMRLSGCVIPDWMLTIKKVIRMRRMTHFFVFFFLSQMWWF